MTMWHLLAVSDRLVQNFSAKLRVLTVLLITKKNTCKLVASGFWDDKKSATFLSNSEIMASGKHFISARVILKMWFVVLGKLTMDFSAEFIRFYGRLHKTRTYSIQIILFSEGIAAFCT